MKNLITTLFTKTVGIIVVVYFVISSSFAYYFYHNEAKESFLLELTSYRSLKAVGKGFIWPYYLFYSENEKSSASSDESLEHFKKSILHIQEAFTIEAELAENKFVSNMNMQSLKFKEALSLRKKALEETKKVTLSSLDKLDSNLKAHYSSEFIVGLEYFISGIENEGGLDPDLVTKGSILLSKFGDFYISIL